MHALERHALLAVCLGDLVRRRSGWHVEPRVKRRTTALSGLELGDEVEYLMVLLAAARSETKGMMVSNGFLESTAPDAVPSPNCIQDNKAGQSDERAQMKCEADTHAVTVVARTARRAKNSAKSRITVGGEC